MTQLAIGVFLVCVVGLVAGTLPQGIDYSQYDPQKLQERYNIIQALVRPRAAYRPKIGSAYATKGYNTNKINYGYQPATYVKQPSYAPAAAKTPVYYNTVKNNAYAPATPVKSTGYATGYVNPAPRQAPINYGYQSYGGIRFGGGKVHPVFNNDLLYKQNKVLGPYDTTDPIFIGGGPTKSVPTNNLKSSAFQAQPAYAAYNKQPSLQIDAYNNRPTGYAYPYYG